MVYRTRLTCLLVGFLTLSACSEPVPDPLVSLTAALSPNAQEIHQRALVIDAHADIEIAGKESRYAGADGRSQVAPDKMRAGGVDAVVMAIAVGPGPRDAQGYADARAKAEEELAAVIKLTETPSNNLILARSADELVGAHESGKGALVAEVMGDSAAP